MKLILHLLFASALITSASAGTYTSSKSAKAVVPPAPLGCDCFAPGFAIGIFGSGVLFNEDDIDDDSLGGGVLAEYFFTENIGIQGSYGIFATEKELHEFDAALVLRYPITSLCLAPYIMGGAGYSTNSQDAWNLFLGGGIDVRCPEWNCVSLFADGAYHWSEDDDADFTIVRIGLKFPL
ncbi:hypothetical protein AYO49_01585 [Verrucomicrobiaceae bacterium SCGC AG-212-N21]|nr:hypothetical protein AYO49_01585 [Verrucomicrobiaceae bacterium SCGC AG-212-N21]